MTPPPFAQLVWASLLVIHFMKSRPAFARSSGSPAGTPKVQAPLIGERRSGPAGTGA